MNFALLNKLIFSPLGLTFLVTLAAVPPTIKLAKRFKMVDDPRKRKHPAHTHQGIIPRAGGLPLFIGLLVSSLVFLPLDRHLQAILAGAAVMVLVGLLDDRFDLNPYLRLGANFLAAGLVVFNGIGITFITNPFNGIINLNPVLATLIALFWIVFLANTVNWSKGFDGQLPGIAAIAALTVALFSLRYSADITQWPTTILASILAGAYLGFLPFNFYPQKIMPGYGGGTLAGFMIAILTILSTSKILTGMVVLGVPLIDAGYSIFRRILSGRSPVWGDRGHLHHKFLDQWGWGKRRTAVFYWLITAFLGTLALSLNSQQKFYTIIMLTVLIGGLLLWFKFFRTLFKPSGRNKP